MRDLLDAHLADIDTQITNLVALRDAATVRDAAFDPEPNTCNPDYVCRYL